MRRLINTSSDTLDLPAYKLLAGGDTLRLAGSLKDGGRILVANVLNPAEFLQITNLDPAWQDSLTSTLLRGAQCGVLLLPALRLPDRGGIVSVLHETASPSRRGGTLIDAIPYGDFYGLSAENAYIYDTLQAGRSLKTVRRESYSGPVFEGGVVVDEDVAVGDANPGIEPKPSLKPASGRFELNRGRKVYEIKNHLGNVLAVVSDVKIGIGPAVLPSLVDYYEADVVEMTDYEPFGMPLSRRRWVSGDKYRFGFQGQEGDDEWNGEGNMLAFKYRVHDAQLGRFLSIDPLAPDYPWNSPYAFSENRVIDGVEYLGLGRDPETEAKGRPNPPDARPDIPGTPTTENWNPVTTQRIRKLAFDAGVHQRVGGGIRFNQQVGAAFESVIIRSFGIPRNTIPFPTKSRKKAVKFIPDFLLRANEAAVAPDNLGFYQQEAGVMGEFPGEQLNFWEAKAGQRVNLYGNDKQITAMIDYLGGLAVRGENGKTVKDLKAKTVALYLIVTSDAIISDGIRSHAENSGVALFLIIPYENPEKEGEFMFSNPKFLNPGLFQWLYDSMFNNSNELVGRPTMIHFR